LGLPLTSHGKCISHVDMTLLRKLDILLHSVMLSSRGNTNSAVKNLV
jgi:hypothetical protein